MLKVKTAANKLKLEDRRNPPSADARWAGRE
jgi:hypothetical protein